MIMPGVYKTSLSLTVFELMALCETKTVCYNAKRHITKPTLVNDFGIQCLLPAEALSLLAEAGTIVTG